MSNPKERFLTVNLDDIWWAFFFTKMTFNAKICSNKDISKHKSNIQFFMKIFVKNYIP